MGGGEQRTGAVRRHPGAGRFRQARHRGMLNAIRYARERKVPYFGICLGMQTMVIEFARNVCGLEHADSTEFDPGHARPRDLQAARVEGRGRTGRHHAPGRLAVPAGPRQLCPRGLRQREISERHRHRYEFNREYEELLTRPACALPARRPTAPTSRSARSPTTPGTWAASSTPSSNPSRMEPHPLFRAFIGAALQSTARRQPAHCARGRRGGGPMRQRR